MAGTEPSSRWGSTSQRMETSSVSTGDKVKRVSSLCGDDGHVLSLLCDPVVSALWAASKGGVRRGGPPVIGSAEPTPQGFSLDRRPSSPTIEETGGPQRSDVHPSWAKRSAGARSPGARKRNGPRSGPSLTTGRPARSRPVTRGNPLRVSSVRLECALAPDRPEGRAVGLFASARSARSRLTLPGAPAATRHVECQHIVGVADPAGRLISGRSHAPGSGKGAKRPRAAVAAGAPGLFFDPSAVLAGLSTRPPGSVSVKPARSGMGCVASRSRRWRWRRRLGG